MSSVLYVGDPEGPHFPRFEYEKSMESRKNLFATVGVGVLFLPFDSVPEVWVRTVNETESVRDWKSKERTRRSGVEWTVDAPSASRFMGGRARSGGLPRLVW